MRFYHKFYDFISLTSRERVILFLFLVYVLFKALNLECEKSLQVSGADDMCKDKGELQIRYNGNSDQIREGRHSDSKELDYFIWKII
jgi:hypothetical protein